MAYVFSALDKVLLAYSIIVPLAVERIAPKPLSKTSVVSTNWSFFVDNQEGWRHQGFLKIYKGFLMFGFPDESSTCVCKVIQWTSYVGKVQDESLRGGLEKTCPAFF